MVVIVRLLGWLLVVMAGLTASAEAVLALGTGAYDGIATREIWTLLAGSTPTFAATPVAATEAARLLAFASRLGAVLMDTPAWAVVGPLGGLLVAASRLRRASRCRRRRSSRFD